MGRGIWEEGWREASEESSDMEEEEKEETDNGVMGSSEVGFIVQRKRKGKQAASHLCSAEL